MVIWLDYFFVKHTLGYKKKEKKIQMDEDIFEWKKSVKWQIMDAIILISMQKHTIAFILILYLLTLFIHKVEPTLLYV